MAKRKTETQPEEARRESRKEILRKRKQEEQLRFVRIGIAVVVAVVVLVIVVALVNEFVLVPSRAVATVNEQEISLRDWQERVRFERAQRIVALENQLELFQGDVGPIQQFAGQTILELQDAESLGQSVLDRMVEEEIVRQAAEDRGLEVTEEEVQARVGELFNFYGGAAPTPQPTATATIQPTPSLTPIPAAGEEGAEAEPTQEPLPTPTQGPTSTPLPTPTPVSEEAFQQEFNDFISEFTALGASEETYRGLVAQQILREQLTDALAEEANLPEEDEQVSMYVLTFPNEEAAVEARQEIQDTDFLTVWNTIRSTPPDPEQDPAEVATATEVLWRTEETLRSSFSDAIAEQALQLPLNVASQPIPAPVSGAVEEEEPRYVIIMVSGREVRDLSQQELETRRQALVSNLIDQVLAAGLVDISEFWRGRTPVVPVLDAKFLAPPTATPPVAGTGGDEGLDIPLPEVPPEDTGGEDSGE